MREGFGGSARAAWLVARHRGLGPQSDKGAVRLPEHRRTALVV